VKVIVVVGGLAGPDEIRPLRPAGAGAGEERA